MPVSPCKICDSPLRSEIESKDTAWKADRTIKWARQKGVPINRAILARHRAGHVDKAEFNDSGKTPPPEIKQTDFTSKIAQDIIAADDTAFLDAVKDRVYQKLLAGELDLKIDSAFKAIEIKHKISDESSNEKLLLEILSEIRADELQRAGRRESPIVETA